VGRRLFDAATCTFRAPSSMVEGVRSFTFYVLRNAQKAKPMK
jgi:hypothetical protein